MQIKHKIDDFLYTIFPLVEKGDLEALKSEFLEYYSYGIIKPEVSIEGDWIIIDVDTTTILSQKAEYQKVVELCDQGNYADAKPILENLIAKNPSVSEYHRIMGQIQSDEGEQNEAINCLIDALRWDSKNGWALLMMGNIFSKFKNDMATAMKYYDQAIVANPEDYISLVNIGWLLFEQKQIEQSKKYLNEALKINNQFPNTHFAFGMIAEHEGDLATAFKNYIQAVRFSENKDTLYQKSARKCFDVANEIIESGLGKNIYLKYKKKLEYEGEKVIELVKDESIKTPAKFEFAETHRKESHTVRYKESYPAVEHLIMHEMVHLDYVLQARKENVNQLFTSN